MEEKRTSVFENGLIWFGAAVSIAEILTGTYFARKISDKVEKALEQDLMHELYG